MASRPCSARSPGRCGARRARRDDELITLGLTEMWVDLEFALGSQVYRVWRQRSKRGRGQSDLHFYIWDEARAIGACWTRATCCSDRRRSSAPCGSTTRRSSTRPSSSRAARDSFTVKTPTERKQILADILGLGRYDQYEERAKSAVQVRRSARSASSPSSGRSTRSWPTAAVEARLAEARHAVESAQAALSLAEAERTAARSQVQALRAQQQL